MSSSSLSEVSKRRIPLAFAVVVCSILVYRAVADSYIVYYQRPFDCGCTVGSCARLDVFTSPVLCVRPQNEDNAVVKRILKKGLWERKIVTSVTKSLVNHPDAVFLDIGSHLGQYSIVAASMGRTCVSVDANPNNIQHLRSSMALNGFGDRMHIVNTGIDDTGGNFIRVSGESQNTGGWRAHPCTRSQPSCVPTTTIDNLIEDLGIDFDRGFIIKMDIEGSEPKAIKGASKVLRHTKAIFMEWQNSQGYAEMFETLRLSGFKAPCNTADECPWDVAWYRERI